jgi:hypothetical protein
MRRNGFQLNEIKIEHVLELMNIYLSEWIDRNDLMWNLVFRYFYVALIVLFLPNVANFIGITLPQFPPILFPIIASILSLYFLYVTVGYAKRLEAIGKTYQKLIDLLPKELQRFSLSDPEIKYGKYFHTRMGAKLCCLMFGVLIFLSIVMICYYSLGETG